MDFTKIQMDTSQSERSPTPAMKTVEAASPVPISMYGSVSTPPAPPDLSPDRTNVSGSKYVEPATSKLGILILLGSQLFASVMALIARYMATSLPGGHRYHPLQIIFVRMSITTVCCYVWMWWNQVEHQPLGRRDVRWLLVFRAMGGFLGLFCLYSSLAYLPLPDSTVITFLGPIVTSFACSIIPALREPFTNIEKLGGLISFFGVVLIARPEFIFHYFHHNSPAALSVPPPVVTPAQRFAAVCVALVGVFGAATAYTTIRWIGTRAHPLIPVVYFSTLTSVSSFFLLLLVPSTGGFIVPISRLEWILVVGVGAGGFIMQYLLTKGFQMVKAGKAGMMLYTQMGFALFFEWIVWGNIPEFMSFIGGSLIFSSAIVVNFWKASGKEAGGAKAKAKTVDEESSLLEVEQPAEGVRN